MRSERAGTSPGDVVVTAGSPALEHPALDRALGRLRDAVCGEGRLGIQFYVSLRGEPVCCTAVGEYRPGVPLTPGHMLPWLCSSKPVTVIALAQLYDAGLLTTDRRVRDVIPEFAAGGKEDVTVEHLLTHTLVYQPIANPVRMDWDDAVAEVSRWPIEAPPGERAYYSIFPSWLILGEMLQRITGENYYSYVRQQVLEPLGMHTATHYEAAGQARPEGVLLERKRTGDLVPITIFEEQDTVRWPGLGLWGPIHELARPLECAVAGGAWQGRRLMSEKAVAHFFSPCRFDIADEFFSGLEAVWGRGVCTDPVWFGAPDEARVAGMTGVFTSLVMGDLDHQLVVAFMTNTMVSWEPVLNRLENIVVGDVYELVEHA